MVAQASPAQTKPSNNLVPVTSMSQAAYFMMKGLKLHKGSRTGYRNEFEFVLEDPDRRIEKLRMEFLSSEARAFDHQVRDLRALVSARRSS